MTTAMTETMSTSRVGRQPVAIPPGVLVSVLGENIEVKGPKGLLKHPLHPFVQIGIENNQVNVSLNKERGHCRKGSGSRLLRAIAGTIRAKISNMVQGVTHGFERKLLLVGVGYRASAQGNTLNLSIGFSHPVTFAMPVGIAVETPSQTEIILKGLDKHLVGHMASKIRAVRGPEPYKGKGIRYADEVVVRKETKKK